MTTSRDKRLVTFNDDTKIQGDKDRKKARQWVISAMVLNTTATPYIKPMPLDVDNGLPGIEMWYGSTDDNEVGFMCHLDTCAAMNTGNLLTHQWLMTKYPHIVSEYIQYNDSEPFEPLQLEVAVTDKDKIEEQSGRLTAIVRYQLRYHQGGKPFILSFGLGEDVRVNSIIGIPTIRQWGGVFDFGSSTFIAKSLNTKFALQYETTAQGLPAGVSFTSRDFIRPHSNMAQLGEALVSSVKTPVNASHTARLYSKPEDIVAVNHNVGATHLHKSFNNSHQE